MFAVARPTRLISVEPLPPTQRVTAVGPAEEANLCGEIPSVSQGGTQDGGRGVKQDGGRVRRQVVGEYATQRRFLDLYFE